MTDTTTVTTPPPGMSPELAALVERAEREGLYLYLPQFKTYYTPEELMRSPELFGYHFSQWGLRTPQERLDYIEGRISFLCFQLRAAKKYIAEITRRRSTAPTPPTA